MAGSPACQMHEDRAAVFTGTFFESGQSIMVCGECLIDFCSVIANPPVGEAALDEGGEVTTPGEGEEPSSPTPDDEPPSSESPGSSPDGTDPGHVEPDDDSDPDADEIAAAARELEEQFLKSPSN